MKRLLLILILTFSFQSWTKADDIRDFQIEGISIGDSLLDYMSAKEIEKNKYFLEQAKENKKYTKINLEKIKNIELYIESTRRWINDLIMDLDTLNYSKLLEDKLIKHHEKQLNQFE